LTHLDTPNILQASSFDARSRCHGQRHFLGDHPAEAPPPQKRKGKWVAPPAILQAFHDLLAAPTEPSVSTIAQSPSEGPLVAEILDKYLDWCQKHRGGRTYDWYLMNDNYTPICQRFTSSSSPREGEIPLS
jgi:hypothetical protein